MNLFEVYGTCQSVDVWIPTPSSTLKTAVSYLLSDANAIGIEEIDENSGVKIYPNPATDQLTLNYRPSNSDELVKIEITNTLGKLYIKMTEVLKIKN